MDLVIEMYTRSFLQECSFYIEHNFNEVTYTIDATVSAIQTNKEWLYAFSENFYIFSYDLNVYIYPVLEMVFTKENVRACFYTATTNLATTLFDQAYPLYIISLPYFSRFFHRIADD